MHSKVSQTNQQHRALISQLLHSKQYQINRALFKLGTYEIVLKIRLNYSFICLLCARVHLQRNACTVVEKTTEERSPSLREDLPANAGTPRNPITMDTVPQCKPFIPYLSVTRSLWVVL